MNTNHPEAKTPRKAEAGNGGPFSGLLSPAFCLLFLCLGVLVVRPARAQVPSHTPGYVPDAFIANTTFHAVGQPLVRVNGAVLTDRDLLREMYSIFPYARLHNGFPKAMEPDIRAGALKMIIFEELVYQEAERRKMTVPPDQVARALVQLRQQCSSESQFQQFLKEEFQGSQKLLQARIERSLLIDKFLKQQVADKAVVTPADARAYYDQHAEAFRLPESFSFQSISFLPPRNATPAQLAEVRKRAQATLGQAKAAKTYEQFGLLAEKVSDDDFHVMMGDHKEADRSKLPPIVATKLMSMQPGQVSDIVQFDANAFTILRLNSHNAPSIRKFETIKDGLREQLERQKTEQLRNALLASLSKNAKIVRTS